MAIKRKLTFVVGAGASWELGFPTGRELLDRISQLAELHPDRGFGRAPKINDDSLSQFLLHVSQEAINETGQRYSNLQNDAVWISQHAQLAPSIDNLLHTHRNKQDLVFVGKALICTALIESEKKSCLMPREHGDKLKFLRQRIGDKSGANSWLGQLFWILAEGYDFEGFLAALANLSFISFNYDRTIQHFLVNAAATYFRLTTENEVQRVNDAIDIVHPYGNLGELSVERNQLKGFGEARVSHAHTRIKTFTEGLDEKVDRRRLLKMISDCEELVFLGFGFHDINLSLLFDGDFSTTMTRVSGTAKGLSDRNKDAVATKIADQLALHHTKLHLWGSDRVRLEDLSCYEYFSANSIGLRS